MSNDQPQDAAFSHTQLKQLRGAIRQEVREVVRAEMRDIIEETVPAIVERVVEPYFTDVQADLTELKDNDASAQANLADTDRHHEALRIAVRSHETRIKNLEHQAA